MELTSTLRYMQYPNGSTPVLSQGPFATILKVLNCPCSDGGKRTAKITGQPSSAWSAPACVKVKGKTVTGFIATKGDNGLVFRANENGKNYLLLPE